MFDLVVLAVKQKRANKRIPNNSLYLEINQRYCDIWDFMVSTDGVWYSLYTDKNEYGGTKICKHLGKECKLSLPWLEKEVIGDITPFTIDEEYIESFIAVLKYLMEKSPVNTIYVLARYQSYERETIIGALTMKEFLTLMKNGMLHANVCYIIKKKVEQSRDVFASEIDSEDFRLPFHQPENGI